MRSPSVTDAVFSFCSRVLPAPARLLVAVSGGCDSTALFHLLLDLRKRLGIERLGIAHVNHGLRGAESDADEAFVRAMAAGAGVDCHVKSLAGMSLDKSGLEAWARGERYRFFADVNHDAGYHLVATGHTADDQAETVLMRLLRGSGLRGLAGIHEQRADGVVRPLLTLTRRQLAGWLEERGIAFRSDSSNSSPAFLRNRIRGELLPALRAQEPRAVARLCACAHQAAQAGELVSRMTNTWARDFVVFSDDQRFSLDNGALADAPLAAEGVAVLLRQRNIAFARGHIERILASAGRIGGRILLPGGWCCHPGKERVEFVNARVTDERFSRALLIPGTTRSGHGGIIEAELMRKEAFDGGYDARNRTVFVDADIVGASLIIRSARGDDAFWPLGASGPRPLKEFLTKQGVPRAVGAHLRVVAQSGGEIVWVPGVRIGHRFRLTEAAESILRLSSQGRMEYNVF